MGKTKIKQSSFSHMAIDTLDGNQHRKENLSMIHLVVLVGCLHHLQSQGAQQLWEDQLPQLYCTTKMNSHYVSTKILQTSQDDNVYHNSNDFIKKSGISPLVLAFNYKMLQVKHSHK